MASTFPHGFPLGHQSLIPSTHGPTLDAFWAASIWETLMSYQPHSIKIRHCRALCQWIENTTSKSHAETYNSLDFYKNVWWRSDIIVMGSVYRALLVLTWFPWSCIIGATFFVSICSGWFQSSFAGVELKIRYIHSDWAAGMRSCDALRQNTSIASSVVDLNRYG